MKRLYAHIFWDGHLALLPRIRLINERHVGLGFQWLNAWLHVWVWVRRDDGRVWPKRMFELLPHVWIHWNDWGLGVHLWFIRWKWHRWLYRTALNQ